MGNLPTLALARAIVKAYRYDDFIPIIIYGPLRIGKSAYALKVLEQVIDYLFGLKLTPTTCRSFMGWDPSENVQQWMDIEKRIPMYIWDDAGYWLYALNWSDPLLVAVQKYMNVIGTDMNCLILTTPDPTWILSKIANMPDMLRVKVMKRDGGKRDTDTKKFSRKAIVYKPYRTPDLKKTGVNKKMIDDFSCKLPQDFYDWYYPIRRHYATEAKKQIMTEVRVRNERKQLRLQKAIDNIKRLEKDLDKRK